MKSRRYFFSAIVASLLLVPLAGHAAERKEMRLKVDRQQVKAWNLFARRLYALQEAILAQHKVRTQVRHGGYAHQPDIYIETRYYDKQSNRLLSRVQRMKAKPRQIQEIEVNIYNKSGQLQRDYLAAYLPYNRNAPIQTLINLHNYHGKLHAFRQFDASGVRIYEQCQGEYQGKHVMISLEQDQLDSGGSQDTRVLHSDAYKKCFAGLPMSVDTYLNPLGEIGANETVQNQQPDETADGYKRLINEITTALKADPKEVSLLIKRGDVYFKLHEFELAIADYSDAIELDKHADKAYLGRGMALGRYGQIRAGIKDLGVYIRRHPNDSFAHTKRGVRYLWIKQLRKAESDFVKAVTLKPSNAEAHDDLGVILARRKDYLGALKHFSAAVKYDPTYFKAYHNQAMVYYITGQDVLALNSANQALALVPDLRNTLLLKAHILQALGRNAEAEKIKADAEFLPAGNWSERISVQ